VTTKRSLQSIAHVKDTKDRKRNAIFDPIAVGARNVSTDPCLSTITLGELREAKHQSQKLQERLLRWIWEGESWSIFAEYDIQITKVKLLPTFESLKIYWSATGAEYIDKVVQRSLDQSVSVEIKERMKSLSDFQNRAIPRIEFIAELAAGQHLQHPSLQSSKSKCNDSTTELQKMKSHTGITSLKLVEPLASNGVNPDFLALEEDFIERREIHGLDYHAVLNEILKDPSYGSSRRF